MLARIMHSADIGDELNVRNVPSRTPAPRRPKRLARNAAQRWRELADVAQRRETEGPPIPVHFGDASEAVHYAQDHKFALYWKGTPAFAKRQRELGERFVARPVFTRKGATYVGLVPLDEQEKASEQEPS